MADRVLTLHALRLLTEDVRATMIPAGYMAKRVEESPDWLEAPGLKDVYSVSGCVSEDFADYINFWKHNGYWLFDSPDVIRQVAGQHSIDLAGTKLFYYSVYESQYDEDKNRWGPFEPERSFGVNVVQPGSMQLEGYDVVTFMAGTNPECSPLSCNSLAKVIRTNEHCLLSSLEEAKELLEHGQFKNSEPGPFRVFAVYSLEWPRQPA